MVNFVKADVKLQWFHNDYHKIGYNFSLDKKYFDKTDGLVFVSTEIKESFLNLHPEYRDKSCFMPNILSSKDVRKGGEATVDDIPFEADKADTVFLSVGRIEFATKSLDRCIDIFKRLKDEGVHFKWLVIGRGPDQEQFSSMISENALDDCVYYIGSRDNPIPYMKKCDALLLPSRNEGKPMVVTEAQIMGLVPVVTNYTSASGQIRNGFDGIILDNNDSAIYKGIKSIANDKEKLAKIRTNLINGEYGNEEEIFYFYDIVNNFDR